MDLILTKVKKKRKAIFKQQVLKETISDECLKFELSNQTNGEKGFLKGALDYVKSYFKDKPTSQRCLDYHMALLVDAKQEASLIEVY